MQDIATVGATLGAHLLGNKLIQLDKMLPEAGIHKEGDLTDDTRKFRLIL
jgi:hypothetical protein